jgi:hypothetical protein
MLLAGPIANFLSGYAILRFSSDQSLISGSFIGVSFFFAAVNLLPLGVQGQHTDGTKIWIMLFRRERALRYLAIRRLTDEIDRGVPMESLAPADLEHATGLRDTSPETVSAHILAYLAAFSQKDDTKAAQLLETAFTYSGYAGPSVREMLALQAAMFQAGRRGRIDLAKQWLADVPNTTQYTAWRSKVEAAISS